MGALHAGHATLIREARKKGDNVVVTIFVNPRQFAPTEDFDAYPRDLEKDFEFCRAEKVAAVFVPAASEIYPDGFGTTVRVEMDEIGEARMRPGHFEGVATIVAKLFVIFRPTAAYFGWKDAQQLVMIRRLALDLGFGIEIVPVETAREEDGLALSSRNVRLSIAERKVSPELYRALKKGEAASMEGAQNDEIIARTRKHLAVSGLKDEYVEIFEDRLIAAVRMEKLRLIDNIALKR